MFSSVTWFASLVAIGSISLIAIGSISLVVIGSISLIAIGSISLVEAGLAERSARDSLASDRRY